MLLEANSQAVFSKPRLYKLMTLDTTESEFIFYTSCKNTDSKQPQYFFALCKCLENRSLASYIFISLRRLAFTFEAPRPLYFTPPSITALMGCVTLLTGFEQRESSSVLDRERIIGQKTADGFTPEHSTVTTRKGLCLVHQCWQVHIREAQRKDGI